MVAVQTIPIPIISFVMISIMLLAVYFAARIAIAYEFTRKILGKNPNVFIIGSQDSGKEKIMENFRNAKIKTENYTFVGTFRLCDISFRDRAFRIISFRSMKDRYTLNMDSFRMIKRKPKLLVFVLQTPADANDAYKQYNLFKEVKKIFFEAPVITVIDKSEVTDKNMGYISKTLWPDVIEIDLGKKAEIGELENAMEKKLFENTSGMYSI